MAKIHSANSRDRDPFEVEIAKQIPALRSLEGIQDAKILRVGVMRTKGWDAGQGLGCARRAGMRAKGWDAGEGPGSFGS